MLKGLVAVTCLAALSFFGWIGWGEYQAVKEQERREELATEAFRQDQITSCRYIVAAWDSGDKAPAVDTFADVPLGLKSCRTLIGLN